MVIQERPMVEKIRVLKSQINLVGEFDLAVLMFLEQVEQQYDQIKTFLGCNPNMIDNV